jgi:hypothetical protein
MNLVSDPFLFFKLILSLAYLSDLIRCDLSSGFACVDAKAWYVGGDRNQGFQ